jgi:transposase-like protein
LLGEDWFDPLEAGVRKHIRSLIEAMLESELDAALNRGRYKRGGPPQGHRHGHRDRRILGTFGPTTVSVPRARLVEADGTTHEWRNRTLPAYKRLTRQAEALIAGTYLAGTNTRRVRRALGALFGGAVGKDTVSRAWRKVQGDWEAWQTFGRRDPNGISRTTTSSASDLPPGRRTPLLAHAARAVTSNWAGLR